MIATFSVHTPATSDSLKTELRCDPLPAAAQHIGESVRAWPVRLTKTNPTEGSPSLGVWVESPQAQGGLGATSPP